VSQDNFVESQDNFVVSPDTLVESPDNFVEGKELLNLYIQRSFVCSADLDNIK
jgi:hypothetical protein